MGRLRSGVLRLLVRDPAERAAIVVGKEQCAVLGDRQRGGAAPRPRRAARPTDRKCLRQGRNASAARRPECAAGSKIHITIHRKSGDPVWSWGLEPRLAQQLRYPLRCDRHFKDPNPARCQRIGNRVEYRRRRAFSSPPARRASIISAYGRPTFFEHPKLTTGHCCWGSREHAASDLASPAWFGARSPRLSPPRRG
jgi:hypothetical protein